MIFNIILAAMFASPAPSFAAEPSLGPAVSTATVAAAAANRRFAALCARGPLAVDALLSDAMFRLDLEVCSGEEVGHLMEYSACRSLQGASGGCETLDGLGRGLRESSAFCRNIAAENRFIFATLRGGDALPACRSMLELDGRRGPSVDKECSAMISLVRAEGPKLSCASLKNAKLVAPGESCEDTRTFWSGAPRDCDLHFKDATARRVCRARAALVAGLRDPAKCASSPACQALTAKSPEACGGLRERFSLTLCARAASDLKNPSPTDKKRMEAEAARAAKVQAQTEAEAKKEAAAKAKLSIRSKPQFRKGEPMQAASPEVLEAIKAVEEGRPIRKPKPKKAPEGEEAPAEQ